MTEGDSLFLYIIKAVFPDVADMPVFMIRAQKAELLERFKNEGYFLEDAVAFPIPQGTRSREKISKIENGISSLNKRIEPYKSSAKFVLISTTVYSAINGIMNFKGYKVLNKEAIPFPGSGQQKRFVEAINKINLLV